MARKVLHIISQAHLDPVWLWLRRDGVSEALTTMQSAVDRLRETPQLCYSRSSAAVCRWVQETDPRRFAEIKELVAAGRWEIVNGWLVQPDCNLPATESFVRQALYGQSWFAAHLGKQAVVGYNVDSFGHAAADEEIILLP